MSCPHLPVLLEVLPLAQAGNAELGSPHAGRSPIDDSDEGPLAQNLLVGFEGPRVQVSMFLAGALFVVGLKGEWQESNHLGASL